MDEFEISSFSMWSLITGILMLVTGLSYRMYMRRRRRRRSDEIVSS